MKTDNSCTISISKIKVLNGDIAEGFPKMKVHFTSVIRNGRILSCSTITDYNEDLDSICDELVKLFI
jgi:hypothetical protein